jgi:DNA-binding transcriptional ArsR family regulator
MKRVGAALLEALKKESAPRNSIRMKGLALSENDIGIFSHLSNRPCSIASQIAKDLDLSRGTVKWHLRKLVKNGLVTSKPFKGRDAFYPIGMLTEGELRAFALLASPERLSALIFVLNKPGESQESVAIGLNASRQSIHRVMIELMGEGLVSASKDGRSVRYYPTDLLSIRGEAYAERRKSLLDGVVSILSSLSLQPRVVKSNVHEAHIILGDRGRQLVLRFGLNPYYSVVQTNNNA